MNSTKSKKKSKTALIPKPIKIKKEDDHIMYPMEHYVDDRVELIRQIFASLKPKTITNLAPEFLKKSKLEDIQEQCLNEVLGISKKRLLSIINSTKCPTDTDTSGDDDINSVEEHISLEEISSDSDIADQKVSKAPKENDKQFSVLELLELQARARAIRSQLALEPVTKIEVDTDSDEENPPPKSKSETVAPSRKKTVNVSNGGPTSSKADQSKRPAAPTKSNTEPAQSVPTKRIKLKRNFRKQAQNNDSNDDEKPNAETTKPATNTEPKKEIRSPSPDVIPIISVPETLCISDSDDEQAVKSKLPKEVEPTKVPEPAKPEPAKSIEILSVVEISSANNSVSRTASLDQADETKEAEEQVPIEPEEGEIFDDDDKTQELSETQSSQPNTNVNVVEQQKQESIETSKDPEEIQCKEEPSTKIEQEEKKISIECDEPQSLVNTESEDDSNDDVISLEGGDLLNEMKEHLDDVTDEPSKEAKSEEVICLDDSSDEEVKHKKKTESWNERWLKSSKVSKVLAASRLGNRVRNKIKESKKAKKLEEAAESELLEQKKTQEYVFTSKHEDGSVEQYKEIQDSIQRKAD